MCILQEDSHLKYIVEYIVEYMRRTI